MVSVADMRQERKRLEVQVRQGEQARAKIEELDKLIAMYRGAEPDSTHRPAKKASRPRKATAKRATAARPAAKRGPARGSGRKTAANPSMCPVEGCRMAGLKGKRGVRRHVLIKHPEYKTRMAELGLE